MSPIHLEQKVCPQVGIILAMRSDWLNSKQQMSQDNFEEDIRKEAYPYLDFISEKYYIFSVGCFYNFMKTI